MKTPQTILIFLATPLLVAFTSQSAMGFSLSFAEKGARDLYIPKLSTTYTDGNDEITVSTTLSPPHVTELPLGGTRILNQLLDAYRLATLNNSAQTKIWNFTKANKALRGNLQVLQYFACTVQIPCRYPNLPNIQQQIPPTLTGVGGGIELNYVRGQGETTQDFRWIQWINTNHASYVKPHKDPAAKAKYLDIDLLNQDTPFYPGGNTRLADKSYRIDFLEEHYWLAEAYLVGTSTFNTTDKIGRIITETNVTIYNGIRWGWKNKVTRRRKQPVPIPVPVPVPAPTPKPFPFIIPDWNIPIPIPKREPVASSASGGGGIGYVTASPKPTPRPSPSPAPRPSPSPAPRPSPSPTPRPTLSPKPSPIVIVSVSPAPSPSPWTPSTFPTPTPWVTSPLGSTSSSVVVSTSTTTTTLPLPSPPRAPAPSPRPAPAPSPRPAPAPSPPRAPAPSPGPRPIRAVSISATSNRNAANLRSSSLVESSSKANTDYFTDISSDLLEDSELSSTDNSLNNANLASISSDLLENPELSSTDSNENQLYLAGISSNLLEDSELSSTESNENQLNLADISSELLEDPELSSTENDENNADIGSISADLLEDPELSSEDNNYDQVDLAGISADLLEDPELSYLDDTLTATTPKVSGKNTDDDALSAEAVPEPTTALGTLLALAVLPAIKRLKNRKNKE
ncbi:MAG: hypothetical protein P2A85_15720 [Microcoleus anatoxicus]|uniref:hypothetical protein n=1 Tax=Microcoleus anatoxicus TaxID=2705319 RepID=UPI0036716129